MNFLKMNFGTILLLLAEALVGVLVLINYEDFTAGIVIVLGAALILGGIVSAVGYFRQPPVEAALSKSLMKALIMLTAGGALVLYPGKLVDTIFVVLGLGLLMVGFFKFQSFVDALRLKTGRWAFHLINALVSIVCAIIAILKSKAAANFISTFIGIVLIAEAVFDLVVLIFARNTVKKDAGV